MCSRHVAVTFPCLLLCLVCNAWFAVGDRAEGEERELVKVSSRAIGQLYKEHHASSGPVPTNNQAATDKLESLAKSTEDSTLKPKGMTFLADSAEQMKTVVNSIDFQQTRDREKLVQDTTKDLASKYQDYAGDLSNIPAGSKSLLANIYSEHKKAHEDIDKALQRNILQNLRRDVNEHNVRKGSESSSNTLDVRDHRSEDSLTSEHSTENAEVNSQRAVKASPVSTGVEDVPSGFE